MICAKSVCVITIIDCNLIETEASISPMTVVGTRMTLVFLRYAVQANLHANSKLVH